MPDKTLKSKVMSWTPIILFCALLYFGPTIFDWIRGLFAPRTETWCCSVNYINKNGKERRTYYSTADIRGDSLLGFYAPDSAWIVLKSSKNKDGEWFISINGIAYNIDQTMSGACYGNLKDIEAELSEPDPGYKEDPR